jgi:rod shape-determining protein MreD
MKELLLYIFIAFVLILLQTTFAYLLPLGPMVPDLVLILCVYWGLNYPTVGAVLGSFALGYSVDVVSSAVLGLNAFALSVVYLAVYLSSRAIWVQNPWWSTVVVFVAALVKGAALVVAWTFILAQDNPGWGMLKYLFLEALLASLLAPGFFYLFKRSQGYLHELKVPL